MSLVGLYINVYLAFLKDRMEIILEKNRLSIYSIEKWWKLLYVILKNRSTGKKKEERER